MLLLRKLTTITASCKQDISSNPASRGVSFLLDPRPTSQATEPCLPKAQFSCARSPIIGGLKSGSFQRKITVYVLRTFHHVSQFRVLSRFSLSFHQPRSHGTPRMATHPIVSFDRGLQSAIRDAKPLTRTNCPNATPNLVNQES